MTLNKLTLKLLLAVTLITSALALTACGDDEPDYPESTLAYGRWRVESMRRDDKDAWRPWTYETTYLDFSATGMYESVGYFGTGRGRWEADRSILSAHIGDGTTTRFRILDGKSAEWIELRATSLYGTMDIRCIHTAD